MEKPKCGDFINEEGRTIPKYNPKTGMRYFTEEECGACPNSNWSGGPTYECLKKAGGSYSWDHRFTGMPMVFEVGVDGPPFRRVDSSEVGELYMTDSDSGRLLKYPDAHTGGTYFYSPNSPGRPLNLIPSNENFVYRINEEEQVPVVFPQQGLEDGNIYLATGVVGQIRGPVGTALGTPGTYYYDGDSSFERLEMPQDADVSIMRFARGGERPETVPNCPLEE